MKKILYTFFVVVIIVAAMGSCKKACNFPQTNLGSHSCMDVRDTLLGNYVGEEKGVYDQIVTKYVTLGEKGPTNIVISGGLQAYFNEQGLITIDTQATFVTLVKPFHVSGTGYFSDTTVGKKTNKYLVLNLTYTSDSFPGTFYYDTFRGIR